MPSLKMTATADLNVKIKNKAANTVNKGKLLVTLFAFIPAPKTTS